MKTVAEGTLAPDFELPDQDGNPIRLSELLADGPVVLFFYPVALSGGCSREACHFRDLATEFKEAGAQRFGISTDPVAAQKKFAESNGFDYPLLSDPENTAAEAYGIKRKLPLGPLSVKRMTFVIDTDRTVLEVIHSERNMQEHADRALDAVRARSAR